MSYGNTPGGEQDNLAGALPPGPGQGGPAGPSGWTPGQQPPPGYGPPGYGPPMYGPPAYYPPGYGAPMYAPPGPRPPRYGGWAVTATIGGVLFSLLIGLPTAIAGLTYGSKVDRLWASGDVQGAYSASRKARGWLTASTVFDLLGLILVAFLIVAHVSSSGVSFTNRSVAPASVVPSPFAIRLTQQQPNQGLTVTSMACQQSGPGTAYCTATLSDGQTITQTVVLPWPNP